MNKIEINIPEGFEIDNEKSNFSKGIIEFKPVEKKLSYEDVTKSLLRYKSGFYLTIPGVLRWLRNPELHFARIPEQGFHNQLFFLSLFCLSYRKLLSFELLSKGLRLYYLAVHIWSISGGRFCCPVPPKPLAKVS